MTIDWETALGDERSAREAVLHEDYGYFERQLTRRGIRIADALARATRFTVSLPSWGVATGGTRFGRFPGPGEPRDVFEKLDDCAVINRLVRCTPDISLHIPWDEPENPSALRAYAEERGLTLGTTNSNTFQDQPG